MNDWLLADAVEQQRRLPGLSKHIVAIIKAAIEWRDADEAMANRRASATVDEWIEIEKRAADARIALREAIKAWEEA